MLVHDVYRIPVIIKQENSIEVAEEPFLLISQTSVLHIFVNQYSSTGKKAYLVEILDMLEVGSAWSVANRPREDYNAETAVATVLEIVETVGLPKSVTFDCDPRFVGSHSGRDFPSAFVKMWHCLRVKVNICPPHRPDMNGIVEKFHRSIDEECLKVERVATLGEVVETVSCYQHHYNYERPTRGGLVATSLPV